MSTDKGSHTSHVSGGQFAVLIHAMSTVFDGWVCKLRDRLGPSASRKLAMLEKDREQERDLLTLVSRLLGPDGSRADEAMKILLDNVRRREYSISELFVELCCLEEAIEESLELCHAGDQKERATLMRWMRTRIKSVFEQVLNETSTIYERVAETGPAYCQVNADGIIVYANEKMQQMLGVENAAGMPLCDAFGDDAGAIREVAQGMYGQENLIRQFTLTSRSGGRAFVHAEIAPILIDGKSRGAYATITDMSSLARVFEKSRLGIVRVDEKLRFTYANRAVLAMAGTDSIAELAMRTLVSDPDSWKTLQDQFAERKKGEGGEYDIKITRADNGRMVPVRVTAMPEFDNKGRMTGALSIIRDIELEGPTEAIHRHIETCRNWEGLLALVAKTIAEIIPYDLFLVSLYTQDGKYARMIFDHPKPEGIGWPKRWFPLSKGLAEWLRDQGTKPVGSLAALTNDTRIQSLLKEEKTVQRMRDFGIESLIRYPVMRANKPLASLMLLSKRSNAFADAERRLGALPIAEVLNTAIYLRMMEEQQFRSGLVKDIANGRDVGGVMRIIVESLVRHYGWPDVGIFRVDDVGGCFRLQAEAHAADGFKYEEPFVQKLDEGILGEVYRTGKPTNVGNVQAHPGFINAHGRTKSELCIPIELDGKTRWLLNVEDQVENAFSEEDKEALQDIVDEARSILEHIFQHFFLDEFIARASEAIFLTDMAGRVVRSNEAAARLLGSPNPAEIEGRRFKDFLAEEDKGIPDVDRKGIPILCRLIKSDGQPVEVLLSEALHEAFGRKVFCAKDLSLMQRLEELEAVGDMFREIAIQTRTPLSMLFTWLRRLRDKTEDASTSELLERAIRQLRKIDLTYERLVFCDVKEGAIPYNPVRLDLQRVLDTVMDELPHSDRERIAVDIRSRLPHLRGDLFQLTFMFQSILTYLLRSVPIDERIPVSMEASESGVAIRITGFAPSKGMEAASPAPDRLAETRTRMDIELSENTIRRFIEEKHGGCYTRRSMKNERMEFLITLPAVRGGD